MSLVTTSVKWLNLQTTRLRLFGLNVKEDLVEQKEESARDVGAAAIAIRVSESERDLSNRNEAGKES